MCMAALNRGKGAAIGWSTTDTSYDIQVMRTSPLSISGASENYKTFNQDGTRKMSTNTHCCKWLGLFLIVKNQAKEKNLEKIVTDYRNCWGLWCVHAHMCYGKVMWRTKLLLTLWALPIILKVCSRRLKPNNPVSFCKLSIENSLPRSYIEKRK